MGKNLVPSWKKYLSYLWEFHIESAPSELNEHLYVSLSKGRFQLATANAIYSFEDLYDNFAKIFDQIDWDIFKPNRILVLGGGMLSVIYLLEQKIGPVQCTVIEYDQQVIYLASKYMLHKIKSSVQMIEADATAFVQTTQEVYDLIIVDIFDDDRIPRQAQSLSFLNQLKRLQAKQHLIIYNRLAKTFKDKKDSILFYESTFLSVFPTANWIDVKGNYMLLSHNQYMI